MLNSVRKAQTARDVDNLLSLQHLMKHVIMCSLHFIFLRN